MNGYDFDVIVIGGGPAGATAAALVAQQGHRTLLLERSPQPAFKVGESLMPATYWTLDRLGLLAAMRQSAHPVKRSVQFFSADGQATTPFYFEDHDPHESSRTWQVLRSDFDRMLLGRAAELGAEVRFGEVVEEILFEADRAVGVQLRGSGNGDRTMLSSRVVVDATGQRALLARQLDILTPQPCLQHAAFFSHFAGAQLDSGRDAGATLIYHTESRRSWFWFIPLPSQRVSVGVVGNVDYLIRERQGDPQAVFEEELARCPALAPRLESAEQLRPMQVIKDYSYGVERMAGDGWVTVGDAAGFIDPIYSTGVFLALKSGEMAADAIDEALTRDDLSGERLGSFVAEFRDGMEAMAQLVYAFYSPEFSFADFLRAYPDCRGELVGLLMGNVYRRPVDRLLTALREQLVPSVAEGTAS
jgi:flavin-dependent dehydrogenase